MSINRVCISGNLTRDPEVRQTASGTLIMELGVAVNDRRKNAQTGEWEDSPNYIDCTMFGTRAQSVSQYLSKGSKVFIEGRLHWSQWERDGQKRSKVTVTVDDIEFGSQKPSQAPQAQQPATYSNQQQMPPQMANQGAYYAAQPGYQQAPQPEYVPASIYDESIPF